MKEYRRKARKNSVKNIYPKIFLHTRLIEKKGKALYDCTLNAENISMFSSFLSVSILFGLMWEWGAEAMIKACCNSPAPCSVPLVCSKCPKYVSFGKGLVFSIWFWIIKEIREKKEAEIQSKLWRKQTEQSRIVSTLSFFTSLSYKMKKKKMEAEGHFVCFITSQTLI